MCDQWAEKVKDEVRDYYGKTLSNSSDLKTNVCTFGAQSRTKSVRQVISQIHPKVIEKFYGCGIPIPECIQGAKIVDLGSGSGRDCFVLSKLVGQEGKVTGIDMTDEQVSTAREYIDYHTKLFGYEEPNVEFVQGFIEDLSSSGLKPNYYDVVISNCVVNLSPDKLKVLQEAHKMLKVGGEFYFSDVFTSDHLDQKLINDPILRGECISGAFQWDDFLHSVSTARFSRPRLVTCQPIQITNQDIQKQLGSAKFISATFRLLKLGEHSQESAESVEYLGTVPDFETALPFDKPNTFKVGEKIIVDSSLLSFLKSSRFQPHFKFEIASGKLPEEIDLNPFSIVEAQVQEPSCCSSKCKC